MAYDLPPPPTPEQATASSWTPPAPTWIPPAQPTAAQVEAARLLGISTGTPITPAAPLSSKRATQTGQMKALAKSATDEMLEILAEIARDTDAPHSARVTAANSLLDRGHGKPVQQVQVGELGTILDDLTEEQLEEMAIASAQKMLSERGLTH